MKVREKGLIGHCRRRTSTLLRETRLDMGYEPAAGLPGLLLSRFRPVNMATTKFSR
jgi:hypothetical protein